MDYSIFHFHALRKFRQTFKYIKYISFQKQTCALHFPYLFNLLKGVKALPLLLTPLRICLRLVHLILKHTP